MSVGALDGQARILPVLFAARVYGDVAIAKQAEAPRSGIGITAARAGAVHDHLGVLVRQNAPGTRLDLINRQMQRTRQVPVAVVLLGQRFDEAGWAITGKSGDQRITIHGSDHLSISAGGGGNRWRLEVR